MTSVSTTTSPEPEIHQSLRRIILRKGRIPIARSLGEFLTPCPWCFKSIAFNADEMEVWIEHTRERCRGWRSECGGKFRLMAAGYERSDGVRIGTEEFERSQRGHGSDH